MGGTGVTRKTCDALRIERRNTDFALVRIEEDGSRHELLLTAANVVHLGMLAPDFARRLLAEKAGEKSGTIGAGLKTTLVRTNVRAIEMLVRLFERGGRRGKVVLTEERARRLAAKLLARADQLAKITGDGAREAAISADEH
jgi:hypothetical protein